MKRFFSLSLVAIGVLSAGLASAEMFPFRDKPFPDIASSHPSHKPIEYLRENNIIRGYVDGTFKPTRRISRAEFTVLLTNPFFLDKITTEDCLAEHIGASATGSTTVFYKDVRMDSWYADQVCIATTRGLVNGFPDNTYGPNKYITFVEAAKIAANVFAFDIKQDEMAEDWYVPYVQRLDELNAIPSTIRRFDQIITRAEAVELVYRLKTNDQTRPSKTFGDLK
jgi:hypothetical protein